MSDYAPIKVIWTDFGGVLTPPVDETIDKFCRDNNVERGKLLPAMSAVSARYGTNDPLEPLDTPLVTEKVWMEQLSEELGGALRIPSLADAWFDGRETNHAWVDVLREARGRGVGVSLLSNMVPSWDGHWRRMVDVDELFDHVVLSFEVGYRKPAPEMFALASQLAGVEPSECLLVDDLPKNCAGAEAAGWRAIHFTDAPSAAAQLWRVLAESR